MNKCNYLVSFAIGKDSEAAQVLNDQESAFDAFYATTESFNVTTDDFKEGNVTIKLHLKLTTLGKKIGFTQEWIKDDLADTIPDDEKDKVDSDKLIDDQKDDQTSSGKVTYADVKGIIESSCVSCHSPGGTRSKSDLSTYQSFKKLGASAVTRIIAETMPPSSPMDAAKSKLFREWRDSGFPEKPKSRSTSSNSTGNIYTMDAGQNLHPSE